MLLSPSAWQRLPQEPNKNKLSLHIHIHNIYSMLTSSWVHEWAVKSHILTAPFWSQVISSPWLACMTASLIGQPLSKFLVKIGVLPDRVSHIFKWPSSLAVNIQRPSPWNPVAITFPVCSPNTTNWFSSRQYVLFLFFFFFLLTGLSLLLAISYNRTEWFPI